MYIYIYNMLFYMFTYSFNVRSSDSTKKLSGTHQESKFITITQHDDDIIIVGKHEFRLCI